MARTNSRTQNRIDPTRPFYAAVGSVDIAVEAARNSVTEAQTRLAKVDFEPRALAVQSRSAVSSRVDDLNKQVASRVDDLNQQYVDLAARGRTLVNRIRGQQATQDLKKSAASTKSAAKRTATQTKKAAASTKSSAKATGTSARKTASAAKRTASGAAKKTGA